MSSFSPYTIPQEPAKWVNPLDLNMVYKDISHKDDIAKQNLDELQQISTQLSSLPVFGADAEMLQQKLQKLKSDMSGLNLTNLGDYNTVSQIKGLISGFKNNEEVLNATKRGSFYKQELQKKKDYEEKGKTYVSPGLRKAEKYYGSGEYIKDLKFNQSGFVAPDDKELDLIAKNTPEWENIVTKGGYDVTQKGKAIDKLQANYLTHFTTNPQWSALLNDQFEQGLEGIDMNQLYNSGINGIKELFPYLPKEQQQEALQDIQEAYQIQQNNPYATSALKDKLRDDFFKNQAYMAAQAKTYVNTTDKKANEFSKIAVQHQNAKELVKEREKAAINKIQEQQRLKSLAGSVSDPLQRKLLERGIEAGYSTELLNEDGTNFKTNPELVAMGLKTDKLEDKPKAEVIRQDLTSFKEIYNNNKNKVTEALKAKAGALGYFFDDADIENVIWDKETNRYTVTVDDAGTTEDISFTQDEIDDISTISYIKDNEEIKIPLTDPDAKAAIEEAEKLGYKKQ
jgi:hypothetical protein